MTYNLGAASRAELAGVHPDLVRVTERAIAITAQDFAIHDGLRTAAEQEANIKAGTSWTMASLHRVQKDGWGHAVDAVPFVAGKKRWEWGGCYAIAVAFWRAAGELGVRMRWGGVWDRRLDALDLSTPEKAKAAVEAYCKRHPGVDRIDGPHFELA